MKVIILILAIIAGALVAWLTIRLTGFSGSYDYDIEKNYKKWRRDLKRKREAESPEEA